MDLFDAFPKVTSWLTLVAFTIAVVGSLISRYLSRDARLISKAPLERRAELIETFLNRNGFDGNKLTKEQKFELIRETIRQRRLPWIVITLGAIFITLVLLAAIVSQDLRSAHLGNSDQPTIRSANDSEMLILVAKFDGPEPENYRFTDIFVSNLREDLADSNVRVETLPIAITLANGGSSRAISEGKKLSAAIVVWGWYGLTSTAAPISINFEVLKSPYDAISPGLCPSAKGALRRAATEDLRSFRLQVQLSNELAYLSLITDGYASYIADDCPHAIELLSQALTNASPDRSYDYLAFFARGDCYRMQNKTFFAVSDFSQSLSRQPTSWAYEKLGDVYNYNANFAKAVDSYQQAIELEAHRAQLFIKLGIDYELTGNETAALRSYSTAISVDENSALGKGERIYTQYLLSGVPAKATNSKDNAELLAIVNTVIAKNPDNPMARRARAKIVSDKNPAIAIADLKYLSAQFPNSSSFHYLLGQIFEFQKKEPLRALTEYDLAIKNDKSHTCSYINRGAIYDQLDKPQLAFESFQKAVESDPSFPKALINRALRYEDQGKYGKALTDLTKAIELDPSLAYTFAYRGRIYLKSGRFFAAYKDTARALKLDPNNIDAASTRIKLTVELLGVFIGLILAGFMIRSALKARDVPLLEEVEN